MRYESNFFTNIKVIVDPLDKLNLRVHLILHNNRFLIHWLAAGDPNKTAKELFSENYWPGLERAFVKVDIDCDGTLRYPGDPDQYPLIQIERHGETVYIYEGAFVCIRNEDGDFFTRMD